MDFKERLKIALELGKIRISMPVALSALAGYVLLNGHIGIRGMMLSVGVLFVSCGSAVINHLQESRTDRLMPRTRNRPLPSGRISKKGALLHAAGYLLAGISILALMFPPAAVLISLLTLIWYNLVYTPLKKTTAFAVVPGSLTGALPPLIGWVAAGGNMMDHQILLVGLFFFIGQIPHFWLLLLMFGDQYALAGLPSLNKVFTPVQIRRISFVWIMTTVASALLVIGYVFTNSILIFFVLLYVFFLLFSMVFRFMIQPEFQPLPAFYRLNILYLIMMISLMIEGLVRN